MSKTKIITRIHGGIGNQIFCYAAARRLAKINNAELVIDDVNGFVRDYDYSRTYQLDHFNIPCRKATKQERLEPFSRMRYRIMRAINSRRPFEGRSYIQQEGVDFDKRLLMVRPQGTMYLDGYWQSERYFKDVEHIIRSDLKFVPPNDAINLDIASRINISQAVAVHVRWFDAPCKVGTHNVSNNYYQSAINLIESSLKEPRYYLFSDQPDAALNKLDLPKDRVFCISHNKSEGNDYADLWLMSQCKHFITANSTFSWWGAWLGEKDGSMVITPNIEQESFEKTNWGFDGLIPDRWLVI